MDGMYAGFAGAKNRSWPGRPAIFWCFILLTDFLPAFATPCGCDLDSVFAIRMVRHSDEYTVGLLILFVRRLRISISIKIKIHPIFEKGRYLRKQLVVLWGKKTFSAAISNLSAANTFASTLKDLDCRFAPLWASRLVG